MVAIGNQWFWTYEVTKVLHFSGCSYTFGEVLVIECYLVKSLELNLGQVRLFETTLNLVLS